MLQEKRYLRTRNIRKKILQKTHKSQKIKRQKSMKITNVVRNTLNRNTVKPLYSGHNWFSEWCRL